MIVARRLAAATGFDLDWNGLGLIFAIAGTVPMIKARSLAAFRTDGPVANCQNNCARCPKGSKCQMTARFCDYKGPRLADQW